MNAMDEIRDTLRQLLAKKGDAGAFTDDELLVTGGRLTSLDVLDVVAMLEGRFELNLAERGFDRADFDSVTAIVKLVESAGS
jgi:acyl carrier protein